MLPDWQERMAETWKSQSTSNSKYNDAKILYCIVLELTGPKTNTGISIKNKVGRYC